jgi:uncharacterized repeat protein (TIGR03803 family)
MKPLMLLGHVLLLCSLGSAQTFLNIVSFNGTNGATPTTAPLLSDSSGNLWGMTEAGGANNSGTVYEISSGVLTTIYSFCSVTNCADGSTPMGGLIIGPDGNFWGTTSLGGAKNCGTLFETNSIGIQTVVHSFCASKYDGKNPEGTPYLASYNSLGPAVYVSTLAGGQYGNGSVWGWLVNQSGYKVVNSFFAGGTEIGAPVGGLYSGLYTYGIASTGGVNNSGAIFGLYGNRLQGGYVFCQKASCADGANPGAYLANAENNLLGVTANGGVNAAGTLFALHDHQIGSGPQFLTLYSFCSVSNCADGSNPIGGVVQDQHGFTYGTTSAGGANGEGTVFKLSGNGKTLSTLYSFCPEAGCADGQNPSGSLSYANGVIYGTTATGGANGMGTVYSLTP